MNDEDLFKKQQGKFKIHSTTGKIEGHSNLKEELLLKTSILDMHVDPIFLHDIKGNCIYLNETACKFMGYTKDELMKTNLYDLNFPEFSKLNLQSEELVKQELRFQSTHFKKDKSIIPVEIHSKLIEVKSEKLILSTVRDITELKKTEKNLRWNINLIRSVAENSPLAFYVIDNKTDSVLYLNHNFCKLWGLKGLEKGIKEGKLKNK
ncbi:PAS domain S-box protein [Methanobacterium sp.]|uniref:PAS domain-containing protein n=1 Tax=Methanobacterium sp. TaxID=2164 RepID=UPI0031597067